MVTGPAAPRCIRWTTPRSAAANQKIYDQKQGATDVGVTKDAVKFGAINMHGMALCNVLIDPLARAMLGAFSAINDRRRRAFRAADALHGL